MPDNYQFGRTGPLGKISFGDKNYSDQFVRTETQPLLAQKRTSPLTITPNIVARMVEQADDQLRTCRIIVDKFSQRMKILQWCEDAIKSPALEPEPEPEPEPPPVPAKKGLFGAKKPAKPAPKPPPKLEKTPKIKSAVVLSGSEQALGLAISKEMVRNQDARRRVQVAAYQFSVAIGAVKEGETNLDRIRRLATAEAFVELEAMDVAKIQGKIYPICNFHEVFKMDSEISRLFPPPTAGG